MSPSPVLLELLSQLSITSSSNIQWSQVRKPLIALGRAAPRGLADMLASCPGGLAYLPQQSLVRSQQSLCGPGHLRIPSLDGTLLRQCLPFSIVFVPIKPGFIRASEPRAGFLGIRADGEKCTRLHSLASQWVLLLVWRCILLFEMTPGERKQLFQGFTLQLATCPLTHFIILLLGLLSSLS